MLDGLNLIVGLLACALAVPALVVFVQVCAAGMARPAAFTYSSSPRPAVAIVVPAHNEAAGIAVTVRALKAQLAAGDRLVVVADNCNDETAALAATAGAEVMIRTDEERRGKGYALDFGVRGLASQPRDFVVIVDADCTLEPHSLDRLVQTCAAVNRPVQALYLMHSPAGAGLGARIGELAWLLRNQVRPLGWHVLGLPCQLMGSGMAFPYGQIRASRLATGEIVEDLQLGIDLAVAGAAPLFCPHARVNSVFPSQTQDLKTQRKRWELGQLSMISRGLPILVSNAFRSRQLSLIGMALDLCVPPLALLVALLLATWSFALALFTLGAALWPAVLSGAALLLLSAAVLGTWYQYGRHVLRPQELVGVPFYLLSKLPTYGQALLKRRVQWIRTARDVAQPASSNSPPDDKRT